MKLWMANYSWHEGRTGTIKEFVAIFVVLVATLFADNATQFAAAV